MTGTNLSISRASPSGKRSGTSTAPPARSPIMRAVASVRLAPSLRYSKNPASDRVRTAAPDSRTARSYSICGTISIPRSPGFLMKTTGSVVVNRVR